MSNISETPEGNEPVKTTTSRPRATARTPKEGATQGSQTQNQTQEGKAPSRRRTSASTSGATGASGTAQNQRSAESATNAAAAASRPAPAPRPASTQPTQSSQSTQRSQSSQSSQPTQRPQHPQGGSSGSRGPANPNATYRSGGPSAPRQHSSGAATANRDGTTAYRQPGSGSGTSGQQRQGYGQGSGGRSTHAPYPNSGNRPAGSSGTGTAHGPGSGAPARQGSRPGSNGSGPNRTGGHSGPGYAGGQRRSGPLHSGPGRSGGRPGTPTQRPAERRVAVVKEKPTGPVAIPPQIMVKDLAELLHATPNELIRNLIKHGIFASINQVVEYENAATIATEMGFEPSQSAVAVAPAVQSERGLSGNEIMMATRNDNDTVVIPPVVTIMGHVDHGKTSLLDTIRKTKVAAGEAGGITQHIGAYQVEVNGKKITFLDTPGHEAFTAMRARGAQVTHIAIIVVAADDGVMPQTREAIAHAQAAKVPIIIALNKIDKDNANPDYVKQQLADMGVVVEDYGGDIVCVPVSARKNIGIDELLEMILLVAELQDIRANPNMLAIGTIIEARLDKASGPMATVLVQQGTLKMGDNIVVGPLYGKVRAMFNDRGKRIQKAPPSTPVSILGLPEVPNAGDHLEAVADERTAKQAAQKVVEQRRSETGPLGQVSLDTLYMQMQEGNVKELNIVLKCDVQGSAEAIKNALSKISEENTTIKVRLISEGIGNISETDVHLASASKAIVIGFNVKADGAATRVAQKEGVDIRYYNVIYKLTDDIESAMTGMLEPTYREAIEGHAEVIQTFKAGRNTVIAGCRVTGGKITRNAQARVMRKGEKVYEGKFDSLRRGKDDVREVTSGYECGIVLDDFTAYEVGDIIEAFVQERVLPGM